MATINFPASPAVNDVYTQNGATWQWDGTSWTAPTGGPGVVHARVGSTTSSATPTINTDLYDIYRLTAQAVDITSFTTNLTGSPAHGDVLVIEITGTAARAITWGASFEASTIALPTTTVLTNMLQVSLMFNSATTKWRCVGTC